MHPVPEACTRFGNRREREGTGSVYTLREQDASFCITLQAIEFDLPPGYNVFFPYAIYPVAAISMTGE